jgi:signal transduction histidine kinase
MVGGTGHESGTAQRGAATALPPGTVAGTIPSGVVSAVGAGAVGAGVLGLVALLNLDQVTPDAIAHDAFRLGAAAFFLAASIFRFTSLRHTSDRHVAFTAGALGVLALMALPFGNLTAQVVGGRVESPLDLAAHATGTAVCLVLLREAVTTGPRRRASERGTLGWVSLGLASVVAVAVVTATLVVAVAITAVGTIELPDGAFGNVLVDVTLTGVWMSLGLLAVLHDRHRTWARRLSLGVVELLRAMDLVRPGLWGLAAVALLASIAMLTAQASYVDLVETSRGSIAVWPTRAAPHSVQHRAAEDPRTSSERVEEVDVAAVVAAIAARRQLAGEDVRVPAGRGVALTRPGDLVATLETLLANADAHAPGSPVTVQLIAISDRVELTVSDRGPGIAGVSADALFDRPGGSLTRARELVRRNGGDLTLRSRIGGCTFLVSLPQVDALPAPRPAAPRPVVDRREPRLANPA